MFILLFNSSQTFLLNQTVKIRFEQHKSIISFIHLGYPAAAVRSPRVKRKVRPKVLKIRCHKNYGTSSTESNSPPPRSSSSPTISTSSSSSASMTSPQKLYKQLSSPRGSSPRTPRSPRMVSIQVCCKCIVHTMLTRD